MNIGLKRSKKHKKDGDEFVYRRILQHEEDKRLERIKSCPCQHAKWIKQCSTCPAILGSEQGDTEMYI